MTKSLFSLRRLFAPRSRRKSVPLYVWVLSWMTTAGLFVLPDLDDILRLTGLPRIEIKLIDPNGATAPVAPQSGLTGVASVIDGDTLEIHGQRIRLYAFDAPETRQTCKKAGISWRCGVEATRALDAFIGRATVSCEQKSKDRYGRIVARCSVKGKDIGSYMVREGWAVAYRQYGKDYIAMEDEARRARRGVWAGSFDMPWDFRKKKT